MHLYTFPQAPNPLRLVYFLQYKGIDITTSEIDLKAKEQFSDDFKAINPASTVPTLVLDDGTVLSDTIAICVYLEALYPEKPLFGNNASEYAQVVGWDHKIYVDGLMSVAEILRNQSDFFKDRAMPGKVNVPQLDAMIDRGRIRLAAFWDDLEQHLKGRDYLVAEQITLADIDAYVICSFSGWVKEQVPEHCGELLRWQKNIAGLLESS